MTSMPGPPAALELIKRGINTSHADRAGNYAPRIIREHKLANGFTHKELQAGLRIALEENRVRANQEVGISGCRHRMHGLVPCG